MATRVAAALAAMSLGFGAMGQSASRAVFVGHYHTTTASVTSFRVNPDDSLTMVGNYPTEMWTSTLALSPDGSLLAAADAAGSQDGSSTMDRFHVFAVAPDASLTKLASFWIDNSPLAAAWLSNEVIAITRSEFGASQIHVWQFDRDALTLTKLSSQASGSFNTALAMHPVDGKLYSQDSTGLNIRRWTINPDWTLTNDLTVGTPNYPLNIRISRDGTKLYAGGGISGDGKKILGYDVAEGVLMPLPGSPYTSPGASPAYPAITDDGAYLFMGHGTDATVRSFAINPDGSLTSTGFMFDVGLQGTIGNMDSMDDLLFVTDDSTATDGIAGLYVFKVHANGSFTLTAPIYDTGAVRAEGGMAVWRGLPPCYADCNGDTIVNTLDVLCYLNLYAAGDPAADCNGDTAVNSLDVLCFLNLYVAGCE